MIITNWSTMLERCCMDIFTTSKPYNDVVITSFWRHVPCVVWSMYMIMSCYANITKKISKSDEYIIYFLSIFLSTNTQIRATSQIKLPFASWKKVPFIVLRVYHVSSISTITFSRDMICIRTIDNRKSFRETVATQQMSRRV